MIPDVIADEIPSESVGEVIEPSVESLDTDKIAEIIATHLASGKGSNVNTGGSCETNPKLHPFIQGLLESLPAPGTDWPDSKRKTWLRAAEDIFALLYKDDNLDLTKGI